jgi:hypothetical protein
MESPLKPEQKPEQLAGLKEIGILTVWLGFWRFGVNPYGLTVKNTPQTVWRNGTDRIPLNGQTDLGGRFGGGGF